MINPQIGCLLTWLCFPCYIGLKSTILRGFFLHIPQSDTAYHKIQANTQKHARILCWGMLAAMVCWWELPHLSSSSTASLRGMMDTVLMITGISWFAVSFGVMPQRFLQTALGITQSMFSAFVIAAVVRLALFLSLNGVEAPLLSTLMIAVFGMLYSAAVRYDTMDLLKLGIDEASLSFFQHNQNLETVLKQVIQQKKNESGVETAAKKKVS